MFKNNLKVELVDNKDSTWKLLEELIIEDEVIGEIRVPAGFETDFASVPRIPVVFELVGDRGASAATVHDYLYSTGVVSRKAADGVLYRALRHTKVGKPRALMMFIGVRAFGFLFYKKK